MYRDVTNFVFKFDNVRSSSNCENFQQIRNSTNVLSALLSNENSWENPCSTTGFICKEESQTVQTNLFFSQIQPITQTTVIERAT